MLYCSALTALEGLLHRTGMNVSPGLFLRSFVPLPPPRLQPVKPAAVWKEKLPVVNHIEYDVTTQQSSAEISPCEKVSNEK